MACDGHNMVLGRIAEGIYIPTEQFESGPSDYDGGISNVIYEEQQTYQQTNYQFDEQPNYQRNSLENTVNNYSPTETQEDATFFQPTDILASYVAPEFGRTADITYTARDSTQNQNINSIVNQPIADPNKNYLDLSTIVNDPQSYSQTPTIDYKRNKLREAISQEKNTNINTERETLIEQIKSLKQPQLIYNEPLKVYNNV